MRTIALILLGGAMLVTVGCSSSRSFSRQDVMADHIASVRPDGTRYDRVQQAPAQPVHARQAVTAYAPATPTYTATTTYTPSQARYVPAPPPPPAMPAARDVTPVVRQPVARQPVQRAMARPAARATTPVRRAPVARPAPKKQASWKVFGGGCAGGT